MAREPIKLTVQKHGNGIRYRRMFKGKVWVSTVYPQDSRRNCSEAWAGFTEWRANRKLNLLREDPKANRWQEVIDAAKALLKRLKSEGDREGWMFWNDQLTLYRLCATGEKFHGIVVGLDAYGFPVREPDPERIETLPMLIVNAPGEVFSQPWDNEPEPAAPNMTARAVVDQYLETLEAQVKSGDRSIGAYAKIRSALDCFAAWFGEKRGMDTITEDDVRDYHAHMLGMIGDKSRSTVSTYFGVWRTFLDNVCDDNPDIPRPANLRSKRYGIKAGQTKVEVFTVDECKSLLELASPRLELWLLLMLNCGFYQGDLANLQASEVDWKAGRIIRSRSKEPNAPTINWKLWPKTFELLKAQGNRTGNVLTKQDGTPLIESGFKEDGKEYRRDAVVSSWRHLVTKAERHKVIPKGWKKTLKQLRKTGATLLEASPHAEFVDTFLDHTRVAKRHYLAGQIVPKFDNAVTWLGKQLGVIETKTKDTASK